MATKKSCITCKKSNKQTKSSVICVGCEQSFCSEHHKEHRKAIKENFDVIIQKFDSLKERVSIEPNGSKSTKKQLMNQVDVWEKSCIEKIKSVAIETKAQIDHLMNKEKIELDMKLAALSNEIKANQSNNDFLETDIEEWNRELRSCESTLRRTLLDNENFIVLKTDTVDLEDYIEVYLNSELSSINIKSKEYWAEPDNTVPYMRSEYRTAQTITEEKPTFLPLLDYMSNINLEYIHNNLNPNGGGCIHENCAVLLTDGSVKCVKDIRPGDIVQTIGKASAQVTMVVKTKCRGRNVKMVRFENGLSITPWHPVKIDGSWKFPYDIHNIEEVPCEAVYNFVLDKGHVILVNGIECITLGHNFKGDVIGHEYFGSNSVVNDLRSLDPTNSGYVCLESGAFIRDPKTKLIVGIRKI